MKKRIYNISLGIFILSVCGSVYWFSRQQSALFTTRNSLHYKSGVQHTPKADKPDEFIKFLTELRTRAGESTPGYSSGYKLKELSKARKNIAGARLTAAYDFKERGPGNVPGRTRALLVDPDDNAHLTYFAGGVGGGVWKTTDGGESWINKTDDLPNLAISWLVMAASNHDILYAGTGEGWGSSTGFIKGSGIYKSTDRGETWTLLPATQNDDFQIVNRIVVDPVNPDVILAATSNDATNAVAFNSGIFKSVDGGSSWTRKFSGQSWVQQIIANPQNFNTLYATVRGNGVYKSTDAGETWILASNGLTAGGRIEMAISSADTTNLFASVVGSASGTGSDLYFSEDAASTWIIGTDVIAGDVDFLGGQGWYDNTILAHPFNANMVYTGGVNLSKFEVKPGTVLDRKFLDAEEAGTGSFMTLINFGAEYYNGKISVGDTIAETFVSVEIRFGPDGQGGYLQQKAHRFTIPAGEGSGVPAADYTFQDYVNVPFQVWDTDNNRQLMVSFRDQQKDGAFNLILADTDNPDANLHSREYIYISNVPYDATAKDPNIGVNGGHEYKNLYFFWPVLSAGATWDETNLPDSKFIISHDVTFEKREVVRTTVSDAYGEYTEVNRFFQSTGSTNQQGFHPDHHNLVPIIWDESVKSFQLIVANDGGVYKSDVSAKPGENNNSWDLAGFSYNTSQFYAVDKAPGESRYVGGLQDNGSWMTVPGEEADATSSYRRANSGDGFGAAWNHARPKELLTTTYYNAIEKSTDGGSSFRAAISGLTDVGAEKAPFITKIENLHSNPDVVLTVGVKGVWRSTNFADSWQLSAISEQWLLSTDPNTRIPSSARVRISQANAQIVWAGAAMQEKPSKASLHVSTDEGKTFTPANNFTAVTLGRISGLATHPILDSTAFALFSFAQGPKILRTDNLGSTWHDISGFGSGKVSTNGFPDVALYDLLVMPYDTAIIWAGTEIGIFESTDAGISWHILNANIPATSIWDLKIVDNQVVVGTHGRGIWSATITELPGQVYIPTIAGVTPAMSGELTFDIYAHSLFDSMYIYVDGALIAKHNQIVQPGIIKLPTSYLSNKAGIAYVRGYYQGAPYVSYLFNFTANSYKPAVDNYENNFDVSTDDFFGFGFTEKNEGGFTGRAIHSEHFYKSAAFYQYVLKSPIRVRAQDALINFQEVVLVETGNNGALPGTAEFNDYVVVQGSLDGINWVNLVDEYDANDRDDWRVAYIKEEAGKQSLYKFRAVDLLETFAANDEVLIRFVLVANIPKEGWGWSIDWLSIQTNDVIAGLNEEDFGLEVSLYPNPVTDNFININAPDEVRSVLIRMYNANGRMVLQKSVKLIGNGRIDLPTDIKDGLYHIVISTTEKRNAVKILLHRQK